MDEFLIPLSESEAWLLDGIFTASLDDKQRLTWLDTCNVRLIRDQVAQVLLQSRGQLQLNGKQLDLLRKVIPTSAHLANVEAARCLKLKLHFEYLQEDKWEQLGIS